MELKLGAYQGQGAISVLEELPKCLDVRRTRHIYGHSDDSDRFQGRGHGFRGGDITKANIQASSGELSLETNGQAISRSNVEQFYGPLKGFQPLHSRRSDFVPISDLCQDHVHNFFNKRDTGCGWDSGESGDDRHLESTSDRKFDTSITDIAKHLIFCSFVYRFDVIEGTGVSGKH